MLTGDSPEVHEAKALCMTGYIQVNVPHSLHVKTALCMFLMKPAAFLSAVPQAVSIDSFSFARQ